MINEFKVWSESNSEAKKELTPDLGLQNWDDFWGTDAKDKLLTYLFPQKFLHWSEQIAQSIHELNNKYKVNSYAKNFLNHKGPHYEAKKYKYVFAQCCQEIAIKDFKTILLEESQTVVYELITIFANNLINHSLLNSIDEKNQDFQDQIDISFKQFDEFKNNFNDVSDQFGLNISISRNGLIFKHDKKITQQIYEPVLNLFSDPKWVDVNRDLSDAFLEYQNNTNKGYSDCITHTVSAVQAFLQIIVHGETGKGNIDKLLQKAIKENRIPNDTFSQKTFKDIQSILMFERQHKGNPHPKKEYGNEKSARLVLNLAMIFFQHCLQP